jgi:hypothetical protein
VYFFSVPDVYVDVQHGLNEYPAFTVVRMNLTDRKGKLTSMSDAVGKIQIDYLHLRGMFKCECNWVNFRRCLTNSALK